MIRCYLYGFKNKKMSDSENEDYDSEDPCAGRDCDMGYCEICGGHTSGGGCLRKGCYQDCCMEYEGCACNCMRCGAVEPYQWCDCGDLKERCKSGTILKLSYFQSRNYRVI